MKELTKALLAVQAGIHNPVKDGKNTHYSKKGETTYATLGAVLDAVKEISTANGIVIMQATGRDELGDFVSTALYHISGESAVCKTYLIVDKANMQGLASSISYARRYGLLCMYSLTQADDDGDAASMTPVGTPYTFPQPEIPRQGNALDAVITFGKKFKDLTYNQVISSKNGLADLKSYAAWAKSTATAEKPLSKYAVEFINVVDSIPVATPSQAAVDFFSFMPGMGDGL